MLEPCLHRLEIVVEVLIDAVRVLQGRRRVSASAFKRLARGEIGSRMVQLRLRRGDLLCWLVCVWISITWMYRHGMPLSGHDV